MPLWSAAGACHKSVATPPEIRCGKGLQGAEKACRARCQEDLLSTTRYVTWSLHTRSRTSLKSMLAKVSQLTVSEAAMPSRMADTRCEEPMCYMAWMLHMCSRTSLKSMLVGTAA